MALLDFVATAGSATEHLFPQDARFDRAKKDDELQRRNVHPCAEHVHRDHNFWVWAVAKLTDALQRAIHIRIASDLLYKVITLFEDVPTNADKLVRMGGMRQIVDGENECLRKSSRFIFMRIGVFCDFLDNLAVAVGSRDAALNFLGRECSFLAPCNLDDIRPR